MFRLLLSPLRPIWRELKSVLMQHLQGQVDQLLTTFRGLLDGMINSLADVIAAEFHTTDILKRSSYGTIRAPNGRSLHFYSFPVEWLTSSSVLVGPLKERLAGEPMLDSKRRELNIDDRSWATLLGQFSQSLVDHGAPLALKRMLDANTGILCDYLVLALPKREPFPFDDGYARYDLVVISEHRDLSAPQARRIWKNRNKPGYEYRIKAF